MVDGHGPSVHYDRIMTLRPIISFAIDFFFIFIKVLSLDPRGVCVCCSSFPIASHHVALAIGNWQLGVGSFQLADGRRQSALSS